MRKQEQSTMNFEDIVKYLHSEECMVKKICFKIYEIKHSMMFIEL